MQNLIKKLVRISNEYDTNFLKLMESTGQDKKVYQKREQQLDRESYKLRDKLGIRAKDPCGEKKCKKGCSYNMTQRNCALFKVMDKAEPLYKEA